MLPDATQKTNTRQMIFCETIPHSAHTGRLAMRGNRNFGIYFCSNEYIPGKNPALPRRFPALERDRKGAFMQITSRGGGGGGGGVGGGGGGGGGDCGGGGAV